MNYVDNWFVDKANRCRLSSRLIVGTGRYSSAVSAFQSIEVSQTSMITVAIRRMTKSAVNHPLWMLLKRVNKENLWILPNTAGSKTGDEAIRLAFLGRDMVQSLGQSDNDFLKLESHSRCQLFNARCHWNLKSS